MIQLKYYKKNNEIVAKYKNSYYTLKDNMPKKIDINKDGLIDVLPFMRKSMTSEWTEMPYNEASEFTKNYLSKNGEAFPTTLLDINPTIGIEYTHNEVNEPFFRLHCKLPKSILNGLCSLIKNIYYMDEEYDDIDALISKYSCQYYQFGDKILESTDALHYGSTHPEEKYTKVTCPYPCVEIIHEGFASYLPCTKDNIDEIVKTCRNAHYNIFDIKYHNLWKCIELEDGKFELGVTYHISENEAKDKASEIWHRYISRNIIGKVLPLK